MIAGKEPIVRQAKMRLFTPPDQKSIVLAELKNTA
jgi:hypothetical protein